MIKIEAEEINRGRKNYIKRKSTGQMKQGRQKALTERQKERQKIDREKKTD